VNKRRKQTPAGASGFSVIEALIASAILLLVAIGILPLFVRSMTNNVSGSESSRVTNHSKSQIEQLFQLPFNSATLRLSAGSSLLVGPQYYEDPDPNRDGDETWVATATAGRGYDWQRTGTIRQYAVSAFADGILQASEAQPWDAPSEFVHFKEIEVAVEPVYHNGFTIVPRLGGVLNRSPRMTARVLKAQ